MLLARRTVQREPGTCQGNAAFRNAWRNVFRVIPASLAIWVAVISFAGDAMRLFYWRRLAGVSSPSVALCHRVFVLGQATRVPDRACLPLQREPITDSSRDKRPSKSAIFCSWVWI